MSDSQQRHPVRKHPMKLSTSVILMVSAVIASVLLVVHMLYFVQVSDTTRDGVKDKARLTAISFSRSPAPSKNVTICCLSWSPIWTASVIRIRMRM